jgi:hypothetical protein
LELNKFTDFARSTKLLEPILDCFFQQNLNVNSEIHVRQVGINKFVEFRYSDRIGTQLSSGFEGGHGTEKGLELGFAKALHLTQLFFQVADLSFSGFGILAILYVERDK